MKFVYIFRSINYESCVKCFVFSVVGQVENVLSILRLFCILIILFREMQRLPGLSGLDQFSE